MQYTMLGRTGLRVSRLCLGCMTYGIAQAGQHEWTLDEAASRPFFRSALEAPYVPHAVAGVSFPMRFNGRVSVAA